VLMKSFRSFYSKYLFLLLLSVVPFASAQDTKRKMAVRLGLAPAKKSMERRARVIVSVDVSHWKTVRAPARLV
jgi:hypothetical protein